MKPEAQIIALAEFEGWKQNGPWGNHWIDPEGRQHEIWGEGIACPDYLKDRNAIHNAWKFLSTSDKYQYSEELNKIVSRDGTFWVIAAEAPQCAEALLRTIGQWVES